MPGQEFSLLVLPAAPLLMTSLQFCSQNLMARLVMRCGLIRKAPDKEPSTWRQYFKEGMTFHLKHSAWQVPA